MNHISLALALAASGNNDRAIAEWKGAIRLSPDVWQARVGLAESLLTVGKPGEAADQCSEVLKQQPGAFKAIVLLGVSLAKQGEIGEAVAELKRAVQLNPKNATGKFLLGLYLAMPAKGSYPCGISPRRPNSNPTMWKGCGKRPGFWLPVPKNRWRSAHRRSSWPAGRWNIPRATRCAPRCACGGAGRDWRFRRSHGRLAASVDVGLCPPRRTAFAGHRRADKTLSPRHALPRSGAIRPGGRRAAVRCARFPFDRRTSTRFGNRRFDL